MLKPKLTYVEATEQSIRNSAQEVFNLDDGRTNKILDILISEADSFNNSGNKVQLSRHLHLIVRRTKNLSIKEKMFASFIIGAVFTQSL